MNPIPGILQEESSTNLDKVTLIKISSKAFSSKSCHTFAMREHTYDKFKECHFFSILGDLHIVQSKHILQFQKLKYFLTFFFCISRTNLYLSDFINDQRTNKRLPGLVVRQQKGRLAFRTAPANSMQSMLALDWRHILPVNLDSSCWRSLGWKWKERLILLVSI